ncbi:DNA-binding transcriptional ArsR family regulator [Catenulispora sp. GAS73]|uniref:ArsR/SmtB family transcription factor n=1 Tax=Catenulispora sp. GAS73 TaxID=3156269 RepID=UPI003510D648
MLRIHFSPGDFARVRFLARPAPLVELKLSLMMSRRRDSALLFGRWRRDVGHSLPATTRPLWDLLQPHRGPAFLDPVSDDLEEGLELVRGTPGRVVRSDVAKLDRAPTPWVRALMARDAHAWDLLDLSLRDAYRSVLATSWNTVREQHAAEFTRFALGSAEHGVERALTALTPGAHLCGASWHLPASRDRDLHLAGRGLTLLPTFHWTHEPLIGAWPDRPLLLVYPAGPGLPPPRTGSTGSTGTPPSDALADVLGPSRARILRLLDHPRTTTELAAQAHLSLPTASSHSAALRRAGLITTTRDGRRVQHTRTDLGRILAEAAPA